MCNDAPRLLAIDTSTDVLHLALCHGPAEWYRSGAAGAQASATLVPAVLAMLGEASLTLGDLDAIAFGRGPGAFTGLRTACAVAQGLALGASCPVLPIDTLMIVAESARGLGAGTDVWAAQDARMGEVYAARYRLGPGGDWQTVEAAALHAPADLRQRLAADPAAALAGNAVRAFGDVLGEGPWATWPAAAPEGPALLRLARRAWQAGQAIDAALALPLYVRDKVAQTTAEREAARAGSAGVAA